MRRQTNSVTRKVPIVARKDHFREPLPVILADSLEVMENYYRSKIQMLEQSLTQLTLLNDAVEIVSVCKEITHAKGMLRKVLLRKRI